jgi:hypothetical protein
MSTVDDIIKHALRLLSVKESGEALTADESNDGLVSLNSILEQMNLQDYMQVNKQKLTQALTANDGSYTFGTGGNNATRPTVIYKAYIRDNNTDYPVRIIGTDEYSDIPFKSTTSSYPYNLYFRPGWPLATVELYPVPSSSGTVLHMETRNALATYTTGTDVVSLPPGYVKYLTYQLAIDISPEYKEASQAVYMGANEAKELIKRTNLRDKPVMVNTARLAVGGGCSGNYLWNY